MNKRENYLRTIRFEKPEYIPMTFAINGACWHTYEREALLDLMEAHTFLFPDFDRKRYQGVITYPPVASKDKPYKDDFGCVWETTMDGITGTVTGHPLSDWSAFDTYQAPDPEVCMGIGPIDWEAERKRIALAKEQGQLTSGGLRHGHTFLQLQDIRGYENLMFDMVDEEPKLMELIKIVENFNLAIVEKYASMGVDMIGYGEDLGMQNGPMLSPEHFRKYIIPVYKTIMKPAKDHDILVHMHSDGHIRYLMDDMLNLGIDVMNLQDLVNGLDWIRDTFHGKKCIELDIDRQKVTALGTPKEIHDLIRDEVKMLGSKEGGLMMIFGLYPGTPLENVKALMDAMEEYAFYYA